MADPAEGYNKNGLSVMLFDCDMSKQAVDGILIKKFFAYYQDAVN